MTESTVSAAKSEFKSNLHSCILCHYQTKSSFTISQHIKRHRQNFASLEPFVCTSSAPEVYKCESCNFQTNSLLNFNKHNVFKATTDITDFDEIFTCKNCDFQTHSQLVFMKHAYVKCGVGIDEDRLCKRVNVYNAKHSEYLKCHRFLKCIPSDNIGWLKCVHCSYRAQIKGDLKNHMTQCHNIRQRFKWFECEQCLFNVKQIFHLREHLLTTHAEYDTDLDC